MKSLVAFTVLVALLSVVSARTAAVKVPPGPIKHFVVLMMENRAFDHMLGWMHEKNPSIIGLNGTESNPWEFGNPSSKEIVVTKTPTDVRSGNVPLYRSPHYMQPELNQCHTETL